jgi:anthranilate synthase component 1
MNYFPSLDDVKKLAHQGNLVPVYREVAGDLETPVSAYLKVARGANSFLLESVEGGERLARYSFIGTEPYRVARCGSGAGPSAFQGDPLTIVEQELGRFRVVPVPGLPRFHGGAVGYLAYETVRHFEPRVPTPEQNPLGLPESVFLFTDTLLVFDHLAHRIKIVSHVRLDGDIEASYRQAMFRIDELARRLQQPVPGLPAPRRDLPARTPTSSMAREDFLLAVEQTKRYIVEGDIIQAVLSLRWSRPTPAPPFEIYRALRSINPSPYMYYLDLGECQIVGASPEMLVRVEDGTITTRPIAGTRRRGLTPDEDAAIEEEFVRNEKERAEHIMLVDLARNDVGRVAQPGTVKVTQLMTVERYSHVMHLVSNVTGRLRGDLSSYDALRACFPAGTLSGAPKVRAMEIIAELEPSQRGPYGGAIGYFDLSGNLDTAITIRTIVVKDGIAHVQAGAGIVYDSVPEMEYEECQNKARAALRAIEQAEAELLQPQGLRGY